MGCLCWVPMRQVQSKPAGEAKYVRPEGQERGKPGTLVGGGGAVVVLVHAKYSKSEVLLCQDYHFALGQSISIVGSIGFAIWVLAVTARDLDGRREVCAWLS